MKGDAWVVTELGMSALHFPGDLMPHVSDLDKLIADDVRQFELGERRRRYISAAEQERMLTETLGEKAQPQPAEKFNVGDAGAGITSKSIWYQFRRVHFAAVVSIAAGEIRKDG